MTPKLFYAGHGSDGYGWGICNRNLRRELAKLVDLVDEPSNDCIVFQPIADHGLRPSTEARGWKNIGYTFFESPLEKSAAENAKQYDLIFCGSTWCQERLRERGIYSKVLIQGVDHEIFYPTATPTGPVPVKNGETWIFSGGKFEYRKGQDLVLAAFKEVLKRHPKTRLVTAWQNPWPSLVESMSESKHIKLPGGAVEPWDRYLGRLCDVNDIPKERVASVAGIIPNVQMADVYRYCDFGVFPNRCEGGTNLVMMEFMACGRPVVANMGTGQWDVLKELELSILTYRPREFDPATHWPRDDMDLLLGCMAYAIDSRHELPKVGEQFAQSMKQWTWERAARTIVENL